MKKSKTGPDAAELMVKIEERLASLEKKIDILVNKPSPSPVPQAVGHFQKPFQRQSHNQNQNQGNRQHSNDARQGGSFRDRVLHKAVCADCRKECEVPFKPTGDRPVYCKECFAKRKGGNSFKVNADSRPRETAHTQPVHAFKPYIIEKKKPAAKKKTTPKARKAKSK